MQSQPQGQVRGRARTRAAVLTSACLFTALALSLVATPAQAKVVYKPHYLSAKNDNAGGSEVVVDAEGRATVVWHVVDRIAGGGQSALLRIQSRRIDANGNRGPVQTLANVSHVFGGAGGRQLAVDSQGRVTVVWETDDGSRTRIQSLRIEANGTPGPIQTLSPADRNASFPRVVVDPQDRATLVWVSSDPTVALGNPRVESLRLGADGTPAPVQTLASANLFNPHPDLAVDPQGRVTVVWSATKSGGSEIRARRLAENGTPEAIQTVSEAQGQDDHQGAQVVVDPQGVATVAWSARDGDVYTTESRRLGTDGTPPAPVQTLTTTPGEFQIAVDPQSRVTMVWGTGLHSPILALRLGADGVPEATQALAGCCSQFPQVAVDSLGRATVAWHREFRDGAGIQSRRIGADGILEPVRTISGKRRNISHLYSVEGVAVDSLGRATVVMEECLGAVVGSSCSQTRVQSVRGEVDPVTRITKGPKGKTAGEEANFRFSSDEAGSTFECKLDDRKWRPCTSPRRYGNLSPGRHVFKVRATAGGNRGKAAKRPWQVAG